MTNITWNVDIWQKMHLNLDNTISRAGLTAPTFYIKGEAPFFVATNLGFISLGKKLSNIIKNTSIGGRIRARCPPNWALININQTLQMFNASDRPMPAWLFRVTV